MQLFRRDEEPAVNGIVAPESKNYPLVIRLKYFFNISVLQQYDGIFTGFIINLDGYTITCRYS